LAYLTERESLFDTFAWANADAPLGTAIWLAPVNPAVFKRFFISGTTYMGTPTPLSFAATPFAYWRGKITYRLEFVCSSFHRGKVAVLFEPNISQNVVIDTQLYLNKQNMWIVDLQETQELTFEVEWAFAKPWAENLTTNLFGDLGSVGFLGDQLIDYANGYIAIVPFTALQSPDDSSIPVNVYISSKDMVFNQLTDDRMPIARPQLESDTSSKAGEISPEITQVVTLNPSSATSDHIGEVCFGEFPISFRGLCKRFSGFDAVPTISGSPGTTITYQHPIIPEPFPTYTGNDPTRHKNLLGYLRYGYLGWRGGIKHRWGMADGPIMSPIERVKISLYPPRVSSIYSFVTSNDNLLSTMNGTVEFVPMTNGGMEFEMPFYTNNLFGISFNKEPFPSSLSMMNPRVSRDFKIVLPYDNLSTTPQAIDDMAIGEDFTLMCFQGAPPFSFTN